MRALHQTNHAVAGAIVAELFVLAAIAMVATRRLKSHRAMPAGLVLLIPSVGLLVAASQLHSTPLLLADTALAAISVALSYRGGLNVVNHLAPDRQRAEVLCAYLLFCYAGVSLPPVGVGILGQLANPDIADSPSPPPSPSSPSSAVGARYRPRPAHSSTGETARKGAAA